MAYFRKLPSGNVRVEIELLGVRDSATKTTMSAAKKWAAQREAEIHAGNDGRFPARTLEDAVRKYLKEVSSKKPGARWEQLRLQAFLRDQPQLARTLFWKIDTPQMAQWRNARLEQVTKGTVQREINLLSNLFQVAWHEWRWRTGSPFTKMGQPGDNPPRTRRTAWTEIKAICRWLGYRTGVVESKQQQVAFAYLLELRTALRLQEILQLGDHNVDFDARVAMVPVHKTGHQTGLPKTVPLLPAALRLLKLVRGRGRYFNVAPSSASSTFYKARKSLGINGLTFHDGKAEVLTRLARKVDILTLSKISGNKDLRILQERYYRESASEIAVRVAAELKNGRRPAS